MSGTTGAAGTPGAISFSTYPASTNRIPGVFAEVDNSQANTGQATQRGLILAQMLNAGTATPNVAVLTAGQTDAQTRFVAGSMAERMISRYRNLDTFGELWVLPLLDDPAGVVATGTVTFAGAATAAGVVSLYIAGQLVPVAVNLGDTPTIIATSAVAAILVLPELPVVGTAAAGVLTLTSKHKGLTQNDIDIRVNYQGSAGGEKLPGGVTATIVAMAGGAQNPTALASALSALTTKTYDFIACPYTDTSSLNAVGLFLNDQTGRWSPFSELFGGAFAAFRGTYGARATFGNARNDQHVSVMGFYDSPSPVWDWTADYTAACAVSLRADPGQPLQTVALNVLAPPIASRDLLTTRNTMLYDGVSTFTVDPSNTVRIENAITTYQLNGAGAADDSYLEVERLYSLQFLIRDLRNYLATQFPRKKLAVDGTRIAPGSNIVTSQIVLASAIARYRYQCSLGNAQDPAGFAAAAVGQNAGRGLVKLLCPFRLVNQLRQTAVLVQFSAP